MIRQGALSNQHHLARAIEFVCPGWQWRLVRQDRKNAHTPYGRGQVFAGELETGSSQLQEGVRKQHRRSEHGHCGRVDAHRKEAALEVDVDRSQEGCVVCLMSRLIPLSLCIIGRRRHPGERRGSIIAAQVQRHRAQHDDRGPLRSGAEQHRQGAEQEALRQDDIGRKVLQHFLDGFVLGGNGVDERPLHDEQVPVRARGDIREPRELGGNVAQVEIGDRREASEGGAAGLDRIAHGVRAIPQ